MELFAKQKNVGGGTCFIRGGREANDGLAPGYAEYEMLWGKQVEMSPC